MISLTIGRHYFEFQLCVENGENNMQILASSLLIVASLVGAGAAQDGGGVNLRLELKKTGTDLRINAWLENRTASPVFLRDYYLPSFTPTHWLVAVVDGKETKMHAELAFVGAPSGGIERKIEPKARLALGEIIVATPAYRRLEREGDKSLLTLSAGMHRIQLKISRKAAEWNDLAERPSAVVSVEVRDPESRN